jgi:hypothetical protein
MSQESGLALSLFVTGFGTNNAHNAIALDDLALAANAFNGCSDFHDYSPKTCAVINLLAFLRAYTLAASGGSPRRIV